MYILTIKKNNNIGDIMKNIIEKLRNNYQDIILREIKINNQIIYIIAIETITNSFNINEFILDSLTTLEKE